MTPLKRLLLLVLLVVAAAPLAQGAQNQPAAPAPGPDVVNVITYIDVSTAGIPRAIGLLRQYRAQVEGPNATVALLQEIGRAHRFAVNEQWRNRAAFEAPQRAAANTQLLAALRSLQSAPPETHVLQGYSLAAERPPGGGRAKLYVISRFEVAPARLTELGGVLRPFAEASRRDEEGMRFDVLQEMPPRQNQFTIFESWSNPEGLEAHRISAHAQRFREALAPLLVGSYDDRLYGRFDPES